MLDSLARRALLALLSALALSFTPHTLRAQTAASDSAGALAAVSRLFDAMARRDTSLARAVLLPGSQFISTVSGAPATPVTPARRQSDVEFLAFLANGRARYLERIWSPLVRLHGPLAEVWAPYDFHIDGAFSHCGVDVFTLMRGAAGWQIANTAYTVERTGCAPSPLGPPAAR
jgi:hypothetical protein